MERREPVGSLWKPILWIIGLQAVCLALGLWFHNKFVVSSAEWASCNESAARLLPDADKSADALRTLSKQHRSDEDFARAAAGVLQNLGQVPGRAVLVTDSRLRVVATSIPSSSEFAPGTQVSFRRSARVAAPSGAVMGALTRTEGATAAVAAPLPNNRYALVYAPAELIATSPKVLREVMPLIGAIAFVWIIGLQAAVIYLIFSRVRMEHHQREVRTSSVSQRRLTDLVRTRDATVFGLAKLAESRDPETGQHLERIASFSVALCTALRGNPRFRDKITPSFTRNIGISSALHDIGKVGVEDAILLKPGPLTQEERERMQTHTLIGGDCIQKIERRLAGSNFLQMAREIALYHHEHWNGNGYPTGLAGEKIPLAARIVAVADVYDALSVRRIYKEAFPHEECVAIVRDEAGKQFDPAIVEVFLQIEKQFEKIAKQFSDRNRTRENSDRFEVACERFNRLTPAEVRTLTSVLDEDRNHQSEELVSGASA